MNRSNAQMGFIGVYLILKGWHLRINKRRLYSKVHQLSSSTNLSLHEHEYGSSASCFNLCTKSQTCQPYSNHFVQRYCNYFLNGVSCSKITLSLDKPILPPPTPFTRTACTEVGDCCISVGTGNSVGEDLTAGASSKGRAQWFPTYII
jgi:hypothetical protein